MSPEIESAKAVRPRKSRRHGYRGYGSPIARNGRDFGGAIHWGRGFGGLGSPGNDGGLLPATEELLSEDLWIPSKRD